MNFETLLGILSNAELLAAIKTILDYIGSFSDDAAEAGFGCDSGECPDCVKEAAKKLADHLA